MTDGRTPPADGRGRSFAGMTEGRFFLSRRHLFIIQVDPDHRLQRPKSLPETVAKPDENVYNKTSDILLKNTGGNISVARKPLLVQETKDKLIKLIEAEYQPGDRIPSEFVLAERFEVSRTTIREAIKQLCTQNVLKIKRGEGIYVTSNPGMTRDPLGMSFVESKRALRDIAELASILQPPLAALAATRATEEDIAEMERVHQEFMDFYETMDQTDEAQIDQARKMESQFHDLLLKACHNEAITRMSSVFSVMLEATTVNKLEVVQISAKYHGKLLEAIKERNPVLAEQTMMLHMSLNAEAAYRD